MYGHGGYFGQQTATILAIFRSPDLRRLHMKFEQNWLSGFRGGRLKVLTDARTDDGQNVITIGHPEHSSGEQKRDEDFRFISI